MAESSLRNKEFEDENIIEIRRCKCESLENSFWVIKIKKEFYFFGKEIAEALDYANPKEAIHDHVDAEDKTSIEEVLGENYMVVLKKIKSDGSKNLPSDFIQKIHRKQKLITELGLISLCSKSKKEKAKPFRRWIYKAIREIRETGSYTLPGGTVSNPLSLLDRIRTFKEEPLQSQQKSSSKISTRKFKIKLEKSIKTLKSEIDRIEIELKKSLKEINSSCSSSSSSPRRYSSDSE